MNAARRVCAGPKTWMMHTMSDKTHEGWSNYETWAVALWIDNQKSSYHYWRDEARRHRKDSPTSPQVQDGTWNAEQAAHFNLADQLKAEFRDAAPLAEPTVYSDLLGAALSEVNWSEIAEQLLADIAEDEHPIFGPIVSTYTRAQAIADGVLVDVSEMAREAGIKHPTALTATVWAQYVQVPEGVVAQDEEGRLWDILNMFRIAAKRSSGSGALLFEVMVRNDNSAPATVTLKAICGPGDTLDPVLTILLPNED